MCLPPSVLPNAITLTSLLLRLAFLASLLPVYCGLIGIALDAADGWVARKLKAESRFGADFDWYSDVACAAMACAVLPYGYCLLPPLVILWAHRKKLPLRVSGAAALMVLVTLARYLL